MLITICKNGEWPRVLVLAPDTPGFPSLEATADGGELAFMREELNGIHVDALIGTVRFTGRNSLADVLRDGNYSILHLITHGDCEVVRLTKESISWHELARLLSQHQVKLVIAMTCNSRSFAAGLLNAGVLQVICTSGEIDNNDARQFTREFYNALVRGARPAEAVAFGRSRMSPAGAALIHLLPDEENVQTDDPMLAALLRIRQDQDELRNEMRTSFANLNAALIGINERHDDALRSLTAAVVHLTEVLAK